MGLSKAKTPAQLALGLRKVRRRRWFLWLLILAYLPLMMFAMRAQQTAQPMILTFGGWIFFLSLAVALMALVRCPQCGNCFHMNGFLFRPVRRCFSCGLPLNADKKK